MSSSFGEKQLQKYGWASGKGVGKNEQGIVKPIKASYKFDTAGVGFDHSEQFTLNWWEHLYNKSAQIIEKSNDDKCFDPSEEKQLKTNDNKKFYLAKFKQGETLTNLNDTNKETIKIEKVIEKDIKDDERKRLKISAITDEELFNICKGRTAHKGARHGIKMNGKLARIMEQEEKMVKQCENNNENEDETSDEPTKKKKKAKKIHKIE